MLRAKLDSFAFSRDRFPLGSYRNFQLSEVNPTFAFSIAALCLLSYKPKPLYLMGVITAIITQHITPVLPILRAVFLLSLSSSHLSLASFTPVDIMH